ncbi:MAG: OmpH family outer membrane protein [Bacteroidales bacterium]
MKKYLLMLIIIGMIAQIAVAQKFKYGYINADKVLSEMPEIEMANKELEGYVKEINDYITKKNDEYSKKLADFQQNEKTMSEIIKTDKQDELNKLAASIKQFQNEAQNTINKKKQDLYQSAIIKLKDAIRAVAKEYGYRFIIDNSNGQLLFCEEEDNVDNLVRKKLGIVK